MITAFMKNLSILILLVLPFPALAYIGPGGGITAIGALIALLLAVLYTFFGFIWFPLKRLFKKIRGKQTDQPVEQVEIETATVDDEKQDAPDTKCQSIYWQY